MHVVSIELSIDTYFMDGIKKEFDKNIENSKKSIVILMEKLFPILYKIENGFKYSYFMGNSKSC